MEDTQIYDNGESTEATNTLWFSSHAAVLRSLSLSLCLCLSLSLSLLSLCSPFSHFREERFRSRFIEVFNHVLHVVEVHNHSFQIGQQRLGPRILRLGTHCCKMLRLSATEIRCCCCSPAAGDTENSNQPKREHLGTTQSRAAGLAVCNPGRGERERERERAGAG